MEKGSQCLKKLCCRVYQSISKLASIKIKSFLVATPLLLPFDGRLQNSARSGRGHAPHVQRRWQASSRNW
ncbi:hypothetical protein AB3R30_23180 [Leptolyngbyaceae cyanobacterium UHCC 1019]